jgi:3'(2'), 5'-bisphosphate nucleotidase
VNADDHVLARELAGRAGRRLLELRSRGGEPDLLRKAGDRLSHEFLVAELAARRPTDAVLSEEGADDRARLAASRVWILDPLDGTREFGEPGRTDWAVHVALWERTGAADGCGGLSADGVGDLVAGAVALPAQDTILSTADQGPPGAATEGRRCHTDAHLRAWVSHPRPWDEPYVVAGSGEDVGGVRQAPDGVDGTAGRVRIVVSRTRAPRLVQDISDLIGAELIPLGSAGAKVAAVVRGEADAYVHAGGFYEWDTAAPVAVARAAGFHASRVDGSPLAYNQAGVFMPDILVCPSALAVPLLRVIREVANAH